jgi:hypothetical protein
LQASLLLYLVEKNLSSEEIRNKEIRNIIVYKLYKATSCNVFYGFASAESNAPLIAP